jgi:ABC-type nitrate/sulfonate/bicarbonate transport system ATPase subunit
LVRIFSITGCSWIAAMISNLSPSHPNELSGRMLKRAWLALALVEGDEPFSALDTLMNLRMRNELLPILGEKRHTVLLITHDVEGKLH